MRRKLGWSTVVRWDGTEGQGTEEHLIGEDYRQGMGYTQRNNTSKS